MTVDELDKELISLLLHNARQSSYQLAKQLKVSPSTIRRRIGELIKNGTIRSTLSVDYSAIGLPLAAHIALNVNHEKLESIWEALRKFHNIKHVSITAGRFDVIGMVRVASTEELLKLVQNEITQIPGVEKCETFICLRIERTS